jgi:hypothetical protein
VFKQQLGRENKRAHLNAQPAVQPANWMYLRQLLALEAQPAGAFCGGGQCIPLLRGDGEVRK